MSHTSTSGPLRARLEDLIAARYGRDGDILERGYGLTRLEAGYATGLMWWNLSDDSTSFQHAHVSGRLDLVLRDLLEDPDASGDARWAARYGYSSPSAISRAFTRRFSVGIGDVRRMGRLGHWLASSKRTPRSAGGRRRREEAERRLLVFREVLSHAPLGRHARRALDELGTQRIPGTCRPRYPQIARAEAARLGGRRA